MADPISNVDLALLRSDKGARRLAEIWESLGIVVEPESDQPSDPNAALALHWIEADVSQIAKELSCVLAMPRRMIERKITLLARARIIRLDGTIAPEASRMLELMADERMPAGMKADARSH